MLKPNKPLEKAADQMKAQYDKKKHPVIKYQVGDKVWLDMTNLNLPRPKKKLTDKQTGPFKIVSKKGASAYTLKLPTNWHIHPTFQRSNSSPHTCHPHSLIRNNCRLHRQILLMVKNTTKSKKSSTVENTRSGERPESHGTGSQITCQMERLQTRVKQLGTRGQLEADELIDKYLADT